MRNLFLYVCIFISTGWSYDEVLKYFKKSEAANLSCADEGYHGKDGMLPVTDIPFKTPIAKAFVNAASEIGMPVVDINGKSQIGVDYIQVINYVIRLSILVTTKHNILINLNYS